MGEILLVLGGARSGKSAVAERVVAEQGERVLYVATARPFGRDMADRVRRHRDRRPPSWTTLEAPTDLRPVIAAADAGADVVMLECLHMWTANRLLALGDAGRDGWWDDVRKLEADLLDEARAVLDAARAARWKLVAVSSEVGLGLPPEPPRQRVFRDVLGRLNEAFSTAADRVFFVVAGVAIDLRRVASL